MEDFVIFVDASCDIDREFAKENGIRYVDMDVTLGEDIFTVTGFNSDEELEEFYEKVRKGAMPTTSQIPPFVYEEYFEPFVKEGKSVVYFCLSSGLSSTYSSACHAAENLKKKYPSATVYPVDTLVATGGIGMMAERAVQLRNDGVSAELTAKQVAEESKKIFGYVYVENLMHLKRGGRINPAVAVVGAMLNIKPLVEITPDGKLEPFAKAKGNKKAIQKMFEVFSSGYAGDEKYSVYIFHTSNFEGAEYLKNLVLEFAPNAVVKTCYLTPIIGTHLGAGSVGIAFKQVNEKE